MRARSSRSLTARLACGRLLHYEAASLVPATGDVVPCLRHGYCSVRPDDGRVVELDPVRRGTRRLPPPSHVALGRFLAQHPVTTVHALRKERFTLRILTQAQAEGVLDLDILTGQVRRRVQDS